MYAYSSLTLERRLFWTLLTMLALLVSSYVYLIQQSVMHVVERRVAMDESAVIGGKIAGLEGQYLAAIGSVTREKAYELGFVDSAEKTSFAYDDASASWRIGFARVNEE